MHVTFNLVLYLILFKTGYFDVNVMDLILMLCTNLIDLDHLKAKPIHHSKRNPFKTHFLHKNWVFIIGAAVILLFFRPVAFLGVGLLSHFLLDFVYVKRAGV